MSYPRAGLPLAPAESPDASSVLLLAVRSGNATTVKNILHTPGGEDMIWHQNQRGYSALHEAVRLDHLQVFRLLLDNITLEGRQAACSRLYVHPIALAIKLDRRELVLECIKRDVFIKDSDQFGQLSTHAAAAYGRRELLQALGEAGVSVTKKDWLGNTPLMRAAENGNLGIARDLMSAFDAQEQEDQAQAQSDPNNDGQTSGAYLLEKNRKGETPVVIAIRCGKLSVAREFLRHPAKDHKFLPNLSRIFRQDLKAMWATARGKDFLAKDLMPRYLLSPEVNASTYRGLCQVVILYGDVEILRACCQCLDTVPEPRKKKILDESRMLVAAFRWNKLQVLQYLLKEGANPNVSADLIAGVPQEDKNTWRLYQALLAAGADVNLRLNNGGSALMAAATVGDHRSVQILLAAGAFPDATNNKGTALHVAAEGRHVAALDVLIKAGCDVHGRAASCKVPALLKAIYSHTTIPVRRRPCVVEVVRLLLGAGVDVNARPVVGRTSDTAVSILLKNPPRYYYSEVLCLLLQAGADVDVTARHRGLTMSLVGLALQRHQYDSARMLIEAGCDVIEQPQAVDVPSFVMNMLMAPRSLKVMCRKRIIKHTGRQKMALFHQLPLPPELIDFLRLKDIRVDYS